MSGGPTCSCEESKKPVAERAWSILDYKCNYSKFNGSRYTPSAYSLITCARCGSYWRTKADYVEALPRG
jgi:hypothetical protein